MVSAVTVPAGYASPERYSSGVRRYQATHTPRKLTANTQAINGPGASTRPDTRASAGIGATSPPEMMDAAEEAVVCEILLSRIAQGWRAPARASSRHNRKPSNSAVMDMLNDQPILRPA